MHRSRTTLSCFYRLICFVSLVLTVMVSLGCGEDDERTTPQFAAVGYGGGTFVAVGRRVATATEEPPSDNALIAVSDDGVDWDVVPLRDEAALYDVVYGNGMFVAVGGARTAVGDGSQEQQVRILTSSDGIQWQQQEATPDFVLRTIAFGNEEFVAMNSGAMMRSSDGLAWAYDSQRELRGTIGLTSKDGWFVGWGSGSVVVRSRDGVHWIGESVDGVWDIRHVSRVNGHLLGTGVENSTSPDEPPRGPLFLRSTNGTDWSVHPAPTNELPRGFAYGDGVYVAIYHDRPPMISSDGDSWFATDGDATGTAVIHADGRFVAVGPDGISTSRDATKWVQRLGMGAF